MATEQLMERKTFTVRGRARAPLFASMTQGMTAADLKRSPMPVLGEVSGKKVAEKPKLTFGEVMKKSRDRAFRGGIAGFAAGVVQVSLRPRLAPRPNDPRFKPALDRISTNEPPIDR
jgi:hypothetical protein